MSHKHPITNEFAEQYVQPSNYYIIQRQDGDTTVYLGIKGWDHIPGQTPTKCEPEGVVVAWGSRELAAEWHVGSPDYVRVKMTKYNGKTEESSWMVGFDVASMLIKKYGGNLVFVSTYGTTGVQVYQKPIIIMDNEFVSDGYHTADYNKNNKQLNVKLTAEDKKEIDSINKDFFEGEATDSMMGRVLLRKGIQFYNKLRNSLDLHGL